MTLQPTDIAPAMDAEDTNPYRAPATLCDVGGQPRTTASGTSRRRMIPVALLYLFGGFLVIGSLIFLGTGLWQLSHGHNPAIEFPSSIMVVPGCLFLYAARSLWRGPQQRGLLITLVAIVVYAAFGVLLACLGLA